MKYRVTITHPMSEFVTSLTSSIILSSQEQAEQYVKRIITDNPLRSARIDPVAICSSCGSDMKQIPDDQLPSCWGSFHCDHCNSTEPIPLTDRAVRIEHLGDRHPASWNPQTREITHWYQGKPETLYECED